MKKNQHPLRQKIIDVLKLIYDPELPINIYALGLIYDIKIEEPGNVKIVMTLTSPMCPMADFIIMEVKDKVGQMKEVKETDIELTFDPPWNPDNLPDDVKLQCGLL